MSEDQIVLLELLKLKERLIKQLNEGNFLVHPKDVIEKVNELILLFEQKE